MKGWCMGGVMVMVVVVMVMPGHVSSIVFPSPVPEENDAEYWYKLMKQEVQDALHLKHNNRIAKNIVFFLGDGLGVTVNTVARIWKGQKAGRSGEEGYLAWDKFPHMALLKTYNLDKQVPDSAGTATAYLTGVKGNYETIGVSGRVKPKDCRASLNPLNRLHSILKWAQDAGKHTGLVTTTQVTHATPAGLYAKSAHRDWSCDSRIKKDGAHMCKDIARQLIEDDPGRNMRVILGGGRQEMGAQKDVNVTLKCPREDGRNLAMEWKEEKERRGEKAAYVTTTGELMNTDTASTDYLMGLFSERQMPYFVERKNTPDGTPTLAQMVQKALGVLTKAEYGFFLLVEGGHIDKGLHRSQTGRPLEEVLQMEEAVLVALRTLNLDETLILVTADHSHTLAFAGYPTRGNHILGVTRNEDVTDGMPYTPLMFTSGPGFFYDWDGTKVQRRNLTGVDTTSMDFVAQSAIPTTPGDETHGGEDVAVFATGPMSHLFHRVHEQTYVAFVMAYSACIGPFLYACPRHTDHTLPNTDHTLPNTEPNTDHNLPNTYHTEPNTDYTHHNHSDHTNHTHHDHSNHADHSNHTNHNHSDHKDHSHHNHSDHTNHTHHNHSDHTDHSHHNHSDHSHHNHSNHSNHNHSDHSHHNHSDQKDHSNRNHSDHTNHTHHNHSAHANHSDHNHTDHSHHNHTDHTNHSHHNHSDHSHHNHSDHTDHSHYNHSDHTHHNHSDHTDHSHYNHSDHSDHTNHSHHNHSNHTDHSRHNHSDHTDHSHHNHTDHSHHNHSDHSDHTNHTHHNHTDHADHSDHTNHSHHNHSDHTDHSHHNHSDHTDHSHHNHTDHTDHTHHNHSDHADHSHHNHSDHKNHTHHNHSDHKNHTHHNHSDHEGENDDDDVSEMVYKIKTSGGDVDDVDGDVEIVAVDDDDDGDEEEEQEEKNTQEKRRRVEEKIKRVKTTRNYYAKGNAVVFCLSPSLLFIHLLFTYGGNVL